MLRVSLGLFHMEKNRQAWTYAFNWLSWSKHLTEAPPVWPLNSDYWLRKENYSSYQLWLYIKAFVAVESAVKKIPKISRSHFSFQSCIVISCDVITVIFLDFAHLPVVSNCLYIVVFTCWRVNNQWTDFDVLNQQSNSLTAALAESSPRLKCDVLLSHTLKS